MSDLSLHIKTKHIDEVSTVRKQCLDEKNGMDTMKINCMQNDVYSKNFKDMEQTVQIDMLNQKEDKDESTHVCELYNSKDTNAECDFKHSKNKIHP